ncbi:MAG: mRNA-degrading endonuclease [Bacteroidota bacterium]
MTLSPRAYNEKVGLAIFCQVTRNEKGYPFEEKIEEQKIQGVILADHVKSLDWKKSEAKFIVKAPVKVVNEVIKLLSTLVN